MAHIRQTRATQSRHRDCSGKARQNETQTARLSTASGFVHLYKTCVARQRGLVRTGVRSQSLRKIKTCRFMRALVTIIAPSVCPCQVHVCEKTAQIWGSGTSGSVPSTCRGLRAVERTLRRSRRGMIQFPPPFDAAVSGYGDVTRISSMYAQLL